MHRSIPSRGSHGLLHRFAILASGMLFSALAAAAPVRVAGFSYVKSLGGIDEYRLDSNGLQVLLKQDSSAPVVTMNVIYRVGSRNEVTGTTGATHMLEHLMFKGSKHYDISAHTDVSSYLERIGSSYNATTYFDRTNYYATVGKDALEGYIAIEADRMRNLMLREADRQSEMTVVRNEFERGKNDPNSLLFEDLAATAYQALPYHHQTIGWRSDIENVSIDKLREFYDTFYWPNNSTVVVVGDFDPAQTLAWIKKGYGVYPKSPHPIPEIYTKEPEQAGPRRVEIRKPGELGTVAIVHKTTEGLDPDQAAITVLDSILSSGKGSRLYRGLVDKGLALDAGAFGIRVRDLNLHYTLAVLAAGATHEQVEKAMLEQIEAIKDKGVTSEELERAKHKFRADRAYRLDGTGPVVSELNEWISLGDWTQQVRFPEAVQKVTAADVQRVARKYFLEDRSTTGWFVPTKSNK
jgi:zinc protease